MLTVVGAIGVLAVVGLGAWWESRTKAAGPARSARKPAPAPVIQAPLLDRRMRVMDRQKLYPLRVPQQDVALDARKNVSAAEAVASKLERELAFANTPENKIVTGYEEYFKLSEDQPWTEVQRALNVDASSAEVATENLRRDVQLEERAARPRTQVLYTTNGECKQGPARTFTIKAATDIGRRPTNEDAELVAEMTFAAGADRHSARLTAVMDGHGGTLIANYIKDNLERVLTDHLKHYNHEGLDDIGVYNALKMTAVVLEDEIRRIFPKDVGGSTLNITLVMDGKDLWTANTGDSRAVLIDLQDPAPVITQLSQDQSVLERRFQGNPLRHGSTIVGHRVNDVAMARAIGVYGGKHLFTPRPKITKVPAPQGKFAILQACDGLWDVMSSDVAGRAVAAALKAGVTSIPEQLIAQAIDERGVGDNVSVVLSVYGATK